MLVSQLADKDGGSESATTFVFDNEGHTLGNGLRFIISSYPDVEFCGYTVPHPAEAKMHFRIQMREGKPAIEALKKGLQDLSKVCDYTLEIFDTEYKQYVETHPVDT
ncbi:DNA-directed RNA polymerases I and III subunit RPAC2 [Atheta coriaria]|uniref:DNA-directed RNA polymerases I and III subunit RPAC2 n=1 Tax=Dalotia coriaria TaxID=877792 RepID=UPI0031F42C18